MSLPHMSSTGGRGIVIDFWTVVAAIVLVGLAIETLEAAAGNPDWVLLVALVAGICTVILHKYPRLNVELLSLS